MKGDILMVCPICRTEYYGEKCPNCNEYADVALQREKVNEAVSRTGRILSEIFKSKRFLTYSIILSVVCGLYSLAFLYAMPYSGLISSAISYGLYIGFGIVSLVAAWKLYSQSSKEKGKDLLARLNYFPKLLHVMAVIAFVCCIILTAMMALGLLVTIGSLSAIDGELVPEIKQMIIEMQSSGEIVLDESLTTEKLFSIIDWIGNYIIVVFIAVVALLGGATAFSYFKMKTYKSITVFVGNLESTAVTYTYISPIKFSSKLIFVIGIIDIVLSAPSALLLGIGALAPVMQGVLLIITSKLFAEINVRLEENARYVFEERKALDNIVAYYREKENRGEI